MLLIHLSAITLVVYQLLRISTVSALTRQVFDDEKYCRICSADRSNFTDKTNTEICRTIPEKITVKNAPQDRNRINGKCEDLFIAFEEGGSPVYEKRRVVWCDFGIQTEKMCASASNLNKPNAVKVYRYKKIDGAFRCDIYDEITV